ncbi:MAG: hypothetical protein ABI227_14020 [Rhodanobacter sp.]
MEQPIRRDRAKERARQPVESVDCFMHLVEDDEPSQATATS